MCEISFFTDETIRSTVGWNRFALMMSYLNERIKEDVSFDNFDLLLFDSISDHNKLIRVNPDFDTLSMMKEIDKHDEVNILLRKLKKITDFERYISFKEEIGVLINCLDHSNFVFNKSLGRPILFAVK